MLAGRGSCSIRVLQGVARRLGKPRMMDQERARGRAETWRPWTGGRSPAPAWPHALGDRARAIGHRVEAWALADVGPGRLVPWLAVAFGLGIVLYFTADREPALWAALALFASAALTAIAARRRPVGFP